MRIPLLAALLALTGIATLGNTPEANAAPAARLWPIWTDSDETSRSTIDHARWQALLDRYVVPAADGINRFAYARVTAPDRALLTTYLDDLAAVDPHTLARREQLPYWINLYNALTVEVVLRHPDKGSILRMGRGLLSIGPWNDELLEIAGHALTLNDIEHRILRPIWQDHRIHYAVNCASLGCPNLQQAAFTAGNVQALLAAAEAAYVNHPRGVSVDDRGRLTLSTIYKWYRRDFAADERALLEHLAQRHETLAQVLSTYRSKVRYRYDWTPNRPDTE